ncbi:FAD/NAD(P)-binding protein [Limimaricola sp.]|uniref:FAD/NAD(P)-binding protein n=1 Tax=Limimaricola sp. TaxID=2211665 RepID=UPI0025BB334F|nr:FAD/NAD(P)-binding protein [Limimaricola sp.]
MTAMPKPGAMPDPMVPRRFRVRKAWDEIDGVATMELDPVDGPQIAFQPGQFNMLYAFGVGEIAVSISGDAARADTLTHTTRAVGAVSTAITRLKAGDMVGVRGPFGSAWPIAEQEGRHIVFVAGGLGLAPLRPAIYHVLNNRDRYAGFTLVYGARSPSELVFADEVKDWKSRFDTEIEVTVDHAAPGWTGHVGVVTTWLDKTLLTVDPATVSAFMCGPEIMMRFSAASLANAGVAAERQFVSLERNMKCAIGFCGHCQYGADFICRDGPVFRYDAVAARLKLKEF